MGSKRSSDEMEEEEDEEMETLSSVFSINSFYGKSRPSVCCGDAKEKVLRVAKGAKAQHQRPLPNEYKFRVFGPPSTWKIFHRQAEAIKFAQMQGGGLMVFAFEGDAVGEGGKRNFVVSHPSLMWFRQCEYPSVQKCRYEVIQELCVCKLYFDLEFYFLFNPNKQGTALTETFICIVLYFLEKEFKVKCPRECVLQLCSSTFVKFSQHLIFNIPGFAFASNIHVGNFVSKVCHHIRSWNSEEKAIEVLGISAEEVNNMFVLDSKNNTVLFCDEGVYTKNRNFRILNSTKFGKNAPLVVAQENQYIPKPNGEVTMEEQLFLDSLVTWLNENHEILTFDDTNYRIIKSQTENKRNGASATLEGLNYSPYTEIDNYIQSLVHPGYIRCWYYFSQGELIVYEISKYRYCHNIGREHKSNGIMYVVNLKTSQYYQKCHDPDCRDFRSDAWMLPENTIFWKDMDDIKMLEWIKGSDLSCENQNIDIPTDTEEDITDEELIGAVRKFEMWDNIDQISTPSSSLLGSQNSSQSLSQHSNPWGSQKSNPWDKLSLLSSPSSSLLDELSQRSTAELEADQNQKLYLNNLCHQAQGTDGKLGLCDIPTDEELVKVASTVEREALLQTSAQNGDEFEISNTS